MLMLMEKARGGRRGYIIDASRPSDDKHDEDPTWRWLVQSSKLRLHIENNVSARFGVVDPGILIGIVNMRNLELRILAIPWNTWRKSGKSEDFAHNRMVDEMTRAVSVLIPLVRSRTYRYILLDSTRTLAVRFRGGVNSPILAVYVIPTPHPLLLTSLPHHPLPVSILVQALIIVDLITQKVIISRHVVFDETHFPFPNFQPRPSSEDYDSFDVDESLPSLSLIIDTSSTPPETGNSTCPSQSPLVEPSGTSSAPSTSGHPMTTRSRTGSLKPKQIFNLSVTSDISRIPRSTTQAMCDPHWRAVRDDEMSPLLFNYTWDLVPKPLNANIVGSRWLYRHKFNSNGCLERYKGRGFSQQPGLDFDDTFSPVVKPTSIRTVLSISISCNWPIHQLDVKNAFLHGDLTETVYMCQPPGYVDSTFLEHVYRLRKALYGLNQTSRFLSSKTDTSLFTYHRGSDTIYLLLYVNDIILTTSSPTLISMVISQLSFEFRMSNLGPLSFFLGIAVSRSTFGLFLSNLPLLRRF
ncbi:hypothetical protein OSB04_012311 [Centaurea solstitialis]|uniref:Reverse transcriptase Ty1/copia-type domain-containing protein n=1 Tax=Centaurea solstitialis TaxID=347529 RepID=A0AA38TU74_9ASTR|nr:hypothetical protein OSB04_012311 [Centaurea solstitialis]